MKTARTSCSRGHFHGGTSKTCGAHVLNCDHRAGLHGFEAGFEQQLFHERIADLHVRALLLRLLGELSRGEQRSAVDSVASCFCADVDYGIAYALGFGQKNFFFFGDAERERVDERVLRIARLKTDFAADGGNAETIPVTSDAANYAVEDSAVGGDRRTVECRGGLQSARGRCGSGRTKVRPYTTLFRDRAETEGIEHSNRPRAHGENVAKDAANAGGRSLEGLDKTRMIVRFDFEGGDEAVADVHDARVFAGPLHDELAARGQALEVHFARFVGAVLAPHHAKDAELGDVRITPKDFSDTRVFFGSEAVFGGDLTSDCGHSYHLTIRSSPGFQS